jgi:hypothetical protein
MKLIRSKDSINNFKPSTLHSLDLNYAQNWLFPGAKTFTYEDCVFSDNQDLLARIRYVKPSSAPHGNVLAAHVAKIDVGSAVVKESAA